MSTVIVAQVSETTIVGQVNETIVIEVVGVGPQGPPGGGYLDTGFESNLKNTGNQAVYTAVADKTIITGVVIRAIAVTGFVAVPVVSFVRASDSEPFATDVELIGLSEDGKARVIMFNGAVPVLDEDDVLRMVVGTGANATTFNAEIDVIGYFAP